MLLLLSSEFMIESEPGIFDDSSYGASFDEVDGFVLLLLFKLSSISAIVGNRSCQIDLSEWYYWLQPCFPLILSFLLSQLLLLLEDY